LDKRKVEREIEEMIAPQLEWRNLFFFIIQNSPKWGIQKL